MKFGITLKPDHHFQRSVELAKRAEANGFAYGWMFDSHVLWRDPYPLLTLMGSATTDMPGTASRPHPRYITVTAIRPRPSMRSPAANDLARPRDRRDA